MKKLIGRKILIKKHLEFKNDGSPCELENIKGVIENVNENYKNYHVQTKDGFYFEVKRHNFRMIKN